MRDYQKKRKKALRRRRIFVTCVAVVLIALCAGLFFGIRGIVRLVQNGGESPKTTDVSTVSGNEDPEEVVLKSSATVINSGDVLIHNPVLAGAKKSDGSYDFSKLFSVTAPFFKKADLAVLNLEVTLGGSESGEYSGYPAFNTPDSLIDALKNDGIGLLLTANNHCYDTRLFGLKRTVQVLKEKGMPYIGTRETADEPTYLVKNVNGIKIGMACFTYETGTPNGAVQDFNNKYLNGNRVATEGRALVNSFSYEHIDDFYAEADATVKKMQEDGADAVVFYMHWGEEYHLKQNVWQETIAQKLCNMGVDVIVGGHPHVVQPMDLLHAEDGDHTTVCLYSMGNGVSNQRLEELSDSCPGGQTEDGMLFYYTFNKYSDGSTVLASVDVIPTWVLKDGSRWNAAYTVYPLETAESAVALGLPSRYAADAANSYSRTKAIVGAGLTECQQALGCDVRFEDFLAVQ